MASIRAHRMSVKLYEAQMHRKYGHGWEGKMLLSERDHLRSLQRSVDIRTKHVYDTYRKVDSDRARMDVAFSDALASIAA